MALKYGIIDQAGAWFSIIDPVTGEQIIKLQGQPKVYEYLSDDANTDVLRKIEDFIDSKIKEDE